MLSLGAAFRDPLGLAPLNDFLPAKLSLAHCKTNGAVCLRTLCSVQMYSMPKSLAKVRNKVIKKKGRTGALHENSRDTRALRRAGARSEKLEKLAIVRSKAKQPLCWILSRNYFYD